MWLHKQDPSNEIGIFKIAIFWFLAHLYNLTWQMSSSHHISDHSHMFTYAVVKNVELKVARAQWFLWFSFLFLNIYTWQNDKLTGKDKDKT